jgi:pyrroline-5-carboxylate reductase
MEPAATSAIGSVLLIGCGRMGGALLKGWRDSRLIADAAVVDPASPILPDGVAWGASLDDISGDLPDTILLAVKPQMMEAALIPLRPRLPGGALVISIAAGTSIAWLSQRLGRDARIVRTMPNTPAAIGRGVTVCCAGPGVDAAARTATDRLMSAVGETAWIDDEQMMHAVTALSGSGPAYVFLLIEALTDAAIAAGLPADLAARLARATVSGSGELVRVSADAPAKLRADVTSPGGTTRAALDVLMAEDGLARLMRAAVAAAAARSRELAAI